jgi:hypothetical protein
MANKLQIIIDAKNLATRAVNGAISKFESMRRVVSRVGGAIRSVFGSLAGQIATAFTIAGVVRFGAAIAKLGDQIDKGSQKIAVTAEEYQKLQFAAERSGAGIDNVEAAFKRQAKVIEDAKGGMQSARDTIAKLGLSLEDLQNSSPNEAFLKISKALSEVTDKTQQAALAQEIFGRSGMELLPMIANVEELGASLEKMGGIISNDAVAAAAKLADEMTNLKSVIMAAAANTGFLSWLSNVVEGLGVVVSNLEHAKMVWLDVFSTVNKYFPPLALAARAARKELEKMESAMIADAGEKAFAAITPESIADTKKKNEDEAAEAAIRAAKREQAAKEIADRATAKARADADKKAADKLEKLQSNEMAAMQRLADMEEARAESASRDAEIEGIDQAIEAKRQEIRTIEQQVAALEDKAEAEKEAADARWAAAIDRARPADRQAERRQSREDQRAKEDAAKAEARARAELAEARRMAGRGFRLTDRQRELIDAANQKDQAAALQDVLAGEKIKIEREGEELARLQADRDKALAKFAEQDYAKGVAEQVEKLEEIRKEIAKLPNPKTTVDVTVSAPPTPPAPDAAAALAAAWDGTVTPPDPVQVEAIAPTPVQVEAIAPAPVQVEALAPPPVKIDTEIIAPNLLAAAMAAAMPRTADPLTNAAYQQVQSSAATIASTQATAVVAANGILQQQLAELKTIAKDLKGNLKAA